jgi:DNA-binding transcriptional regulator YiaG
VYTDMTGGLTMPTASAAAGTQRTREPKGDEQAIRDLRTWREQVYYETQHEFAARLGVNPATLSMWETGRRRPRLRMHRAMAEKLQLKPWQITFPTAQDRTG